VLNLGELNTTQIQRWQQAKSERLRRPWSPTTSLVTFCSFLPFHSMPPPAKSFTVLHRVAVAGKMRSAIVARRHYAKIPRKKLRQIIREVTALPTSYDSLLLRSTRIPVGYRHTVVA
jgi:hypothetical protein